MKIVKYIITIKDIMRDSSFILECDSESELKLKYERYSEDTDYEVISMQSVLIEINPISAKSWNIGE